MKEKYFRYSILTALMIIMAVPAFSQDGNGSDYSAVEASNYCGKNISTYLLFPYSLKA